MKIKKKDTDPPKFPPMRHPPVFTEADAKAAQRHQVEQRLQSNSGIRPAYPELMFLGAPAAAKPAFNITKNVVTQAKPSALKKFAGMLLPFADDAVVAGSQLFGGDDNQTIYKSGGKVSKSKAYYDANPGAKKKKAEYDTKYHSTDERKKYRAFLNRVNRKAGKYGNGDGLDYDHGARKFMSAAKNRAKK